MIAELPAPDRKGDVASSPLRIVAMFIALCEALATAGAIATDGTARMTLTSFAVVFPFVVLMVFVWLLVKHTEKLYPPDAYTANTSIEAFAAATRRQARDTQRLIDNARSAVELAVDRTLGSSSVGEEDATSMRQHLVATFDEAVEEASVTVVRRLIIGDAESYQVPVTLEMTVQELLDSVYLSLAPAVGPYTYGTDWVLVREDQEVLRDMGTNRRDNAGVDGDVRRLSEVGITAGMTLTAVRRGHRTFP